MNFENFKRTLGYYLGIDIGTNSVGFAATGLDYVPLKHRGKNVLGVHLFDESKSAAERRSFRTARRRTERKRQRISLLQELCAEEIAKVDDKFFLRLKESALYKEDKSADLTTTDAIFADKDFSDKDYYEKYPTIHHLICDLIENKEKHDVRLVYLACAYLMKHRGHFLSEVNKDDISKVKDFGLIYERFEDYFSQNGYALPWECDENEFSEVLKQEKGITAKEKDFKDLLFGGKWENDDYPYDKRMMIKLLCGGTVKLKQLFKKDEYEELGSVALMKDDDELFQICSGIGDDDELIFILKQLYDWSVLSKVLSGSDLISEAKVLTYEAHKEDLANLKDLINKYCPEKYNEVFRDVISTSNNYVAYSGNFKWAKNADKEKYKTCKAEDFLKYIKKILQGITPDDEDKALYDEVVEKAELGTFLPKQVSVDNRVIPYQLYYYELKRILDNAEGYLPFLSDIDEDGYKTKDKILSIFEFRIPYFVGPLRRDNSKFAWIERKAQGKIYPWNFEEMVDFEKSEQAFIDRMTASCTYLGGASVLPKNSLLYSRYMVLNEINNIKINGNPIPVEVKQKIYNDLFKRFKTVTPKRIRDMLKSNGLIKDEDVLTGLDTTIKSKLTSYHAFKRLLDCGALTEADVERIIERMAYTEDSTRLLKWLKTEFPSLSEDDIKYVSKLKLKDFGRLSREFLCETLGTNEKTGEAYTIMEALWETNENLMKLLSDRYSFRDEIEKRNKEYYDTHPQSISDRLEDMYIPNAVKRPILRTLDIVKDIVKLKGAPKKIFIEMARDVDSGKQGRRTKSRRDQILDYYKNSTADTDKLIGELASKTDRQLQSERLFLYFMQLGKCMYSGETIDINRLFDKTYDVDHIYPRSMVKDDSLANKALVLSKINGDKSDNYPIKSEIRSKMTPFWNMLLGDGLITKEKYNRLTRHEPFSENEKWGFINRQLVETRQSTKAVATLLKEMLPDTEIVYVKAGLVSEFRNEFGFWKSRTVNDLHHAKDAYLNIVVGNVYNSYFSMKNRGFNISNKYSIKTDTLFKYPRKYNNNIIWNGKEDLEKVKKVMAGNDIHLTTYAYKSKGKLYDVNPIKAADGLVPKKKGMDPKKYGGYNSTKASFFSLVKFTYEKKTARSIKTGTDIAIMPVEIMYADRFLKDEAFSEEYAKRTLSVLSKKNVTSVEFLLNKRPIKVRTMFVLDGFYAFLRGKTNSRMVLSSFNTLRVDPEREEYIKHIESFLQRLKKNVDIEVDEEFDKLSRDKNIDLYDFYLEKAGIRPFIVCFKTAYDYLKEGREKFLELSVKDQVKCLESIIALYKTGRARGCDLTLIGGKSRSCEFAESLFFSNLHKNYSSFRICDTSASGLYKTVSGNLFDLL